MFSGLPFATRMLISSLAGRAVVDAFVFSEERRARLSPSQERRTLDVYLRSAEALELLRTARDPLWDSPFDLKQLAQLPDGSLGRAYADLMAKTGHNPYALPVPRLNAPQGVEADALLFFISRIRKTHDVWHVVTGFATDLRGELGLQGFYWGQGLAPTWSVARGLLPPLFRRDFSLTREFLAAMKAGYDSGRSADPLLGVAWETHWSDDLGALRRRLRIKPVART